MGIESAIEYVDFFIKLNMGENVSLLSFVNNEKRVLKQNLEHKNLEKEPALGKVLPCDLKQI